MKTITMQCANGCDDNISFNYEELIYTLNRLKIKHISVSESLEYKILKFISEHEKCGIWGDKDNKPVVTEYPTLKEDLYKAFSKQKVLA